MRTKIFVIVAVMSLVWSVGTIAAAQAQGQSADAELQRFQGTWVMVSAEMDGKKVDDAHVKKSKITFVGDKVELITPHQHKDKIVASIAKLDLTKNPRKCTGFALQVRTPAPPCSGSMSLRGPTSSRFCFDPAGLAVPKKFGTKSGIRTYLAHLEAGKAVVTGRPKGKPLDRGGARGDVDGEV